MVHAKNYGTASTFVKVIQRKLLASFFRTRCTCMSVAVIEEGNWMSLVDDVKRVNDSAKFDAVLCLGNSFAHLPDFEGDLLHQRRALGNFKALLKPGGILVIDHRNYDEILTSGLVPAKNIYYNVNSFD